MNTRDNQRSRITGMLLKQAYLGLMRTRPASRITVKDICAGAEVNRSTFYLHYAEPNDILVELEDETIARVNGALGAIGASDAGSPDARRRLLSLLDYIRGNSELFRVLLAENSDPHFRRKLQAVAMDMVASSFRVAFPPEYGDYACRYIVSGSIELIACWIRDGYTVPEKTMCDMLYRLCEGSLKKVCL